jgi:hypothetical protein
MIDMKKHDGVESRTRESRTNAKKRGKNAIVYTKGGGWGGGESSTRTHNAERKRDIA